MWDENQLVDSVFLAAMKIARLAYHVLRFLVVICCLYFFFCSLDLLSTAGKLITGKYASAFLAGYPILKNPIVGFMLGVFGTVLLESSSATTSVLVGLVSGQVVEVRQAIPIVIGANVGTSVTSTFVALLQIRHDEYFGPSFSCAVVHDFFNWMTAVTLLITEELTGYLYHTSLATIRLLNLHSSSSNPPELLRALTKPLTERIILIDKDVLRGWSTNDTRYDNVDSLLKKDCQLNVSDSNVTLGLNGTTCSYLFASSNYSDFYIGLILLFGSIGLLALCLFVFVKILHKLLRKDIHKSLTMTFNQGCAAWSYFFDYFLIIFGALITFLVQSSSVFTSILIPMVGSGFISLQQAYPLTLGSNIGTTTTGILAALASQPQFLDRSLQVAICHLYFNLTGILLFFVVPFMRFPIPCAQAFGKKVTKHRWFAVMYLLFAFILIPLYVFGLSILSNVAIYIGVILPLVILIVAVSINILQSKAPKFLPEVLKNWNFLPLYMHSLKPYDRFFPNFDCRDERREAMNDFIMAQARRNNDQPQDQRRRRSSVM